MTRDLHRGAAALHVEIRLAHVIAHRAEYPDAYDETGQWIGRPHETGSS